METAQQLCNYEAITKRLAHHPKAGGTALNDAGRALATSLLDRLAQAFPGDPGIRAITDTLRRGNWQPGELVALAFRQSSNIGANYNYEQATWCWLGNPIKRGFFRTICG